MELKLDDAGHAVLSDGMPVYVHSDGKEIPLDAASLVRRVDNLTSEKDRHFKTASDLKATLDLFGDIKPDAAKSAMATVKNLKDKELLDADGIKAMKEEWAKYSEAEKQGLLDNHANALKEKDGEIKTLIDRIHNQHLLTDFQKSKFFAGEDKITKLPPEVGLTTFGKYFEVREVDGELVTIGKLNGADIQSKKRFGFPADFDEAMAEIFDGHHLKNELMEVKQGGPDVRGRNNNSGGRDVIISRADAKIPAKYRAAKEAAAKTGGRVIKE